MDEILEDMGEVKEGVENLQVGLMNSIQDLLKEVKSQLGDLSEDEIDIYIDIKRGMKQDQDEFCVDKIVNLITSILPCSSSSSFISYFGHLSLFYNP